MDAHALLTAQGWRGTGHSLHPTSDGNGLAHHILVRRNADGAGLGSRTKEHKAEAWWLNAFDQALKGIDVGGSSSGGSGVRQTLRGGGALGKIVSRGAAKYTGSRGLYHSFVPGGVLQGSVEIAATALPTPPDSDGGSGAEKRKEDKERAETKEERRARREARRARRERRRAEKEDKRSRAAEKVQKKKAKKAEREAAEERERERERRRERKDEKARAKAEAEVKAGETREERRARRDARRKRKEERRRRRETETAG